MNREGWLTELSRKLSEQVFHTFTIPQFRVTMGWPCQGGYAFKKRVIGECHSFRTSAGGVYEVFISPTLDSPLEVAGTLCHEMVHVVVGTEAKHGHRFVKACRFIGLTAGSPLNAHPGEQLTARLEQILTPMGKYPHEKIVPSLVLKKPKAKSDIKICCSDCPCGFRIAKKWIAKSGFPRCGCGGEMVVEETGK